MIIKKGIKCILNLYVFSLFDILQVEVSDFYLQNVFEFKFDFLAYFSMKKMHAIDFLYSKNFQL